MKNLLILTALLFTYIVNGQTLIFVEPGYLQYGIGYHQQINKSFGSYAKLRNGDVNITSKIDGLKFKFSTDIIKFGVGMSFNPWANSKKLGMNKNGSFLIGINYSIPYNTMDNNPNVDMERIKKISFDLGFLSQINDSRIFLYGTSDLLNWETELGVGIKF
jgi:hypothetical protein